MFQFLAILSNDTINIIRHVFGRHKYSFMFPISLHIYLSLVDSEEFSKMAVLIYISTSNV